MHAFVLKDNFGRFLSKIVKIENVFSETVNQTVLFMNTVFNKL